MPVIPEKRIHELFQFSVLLKGVHAALEVVGGLVLASISTHAIKSAVAYLTQDELNEQPNDVVASYLAHAAQHLSVGGKTFAAFYLLSHGIIKVALVAGLLRDKLWAYPASLGALSLFILYQLYRFSFTHSLGLIALSIFDVLVIVLVWHEYRLIRQHRPRT